MPTMPGISFCVRVGKIVLPDCASSELLLRGVQYGVKIVRCDHEFNEESHRNRNNQNRKRHPQVLAAASEALKRFGLNVAASRVTTGNHHLYGELEDALKNFFGSKSATLASSGYAPNLIAAQALPGNFSHALIDERSHVSLVDAAQFLVAAKFVPR